MSGISCENKKILQKFSFFLLNSRERQKTYYT